MITRSLFRQNLQEMRTDIVFIWTSRITLGICTLGLLILVFAWQRLPPQVPFFYSLPWGNEQLTEPLTLIIMLLIGGLVYAGNLTLALFIKQMSVFLARLLLIGGLTYTLLLFYTIMHIIILIT